MTLQFFKVGHGAPGVNHGKKMENNLVLCTAMMTECECPTDLCFLRQNIN